MAHVSHAVAQRTTRKAEDVASAEIRSRVGTFAVFDGHGGKAAAAACGERLIPSLLDLAAPLAPRAIEDAFWAMDQALGEARVGSGTTATVLHVSEKCAPCEGDSTPMDSAGKLRRVTH